MGTFSAIRAVNYAVKWAGTYNPRFRQYEISSSRMTNAEYGGAGGDCTNFVSQCLLMGGWTMIRGSVLSSRRDLTVWYYDETANYYGQPCSRSWTDAATFALFAYNCGRMKSIYKDQGLKEVRKELQPGDIIQFRHGVDTYETYHSSIITHVDKDPDKTRLHQHGSKATRLLDEWFCRQYRETHMFVWRPNATFSD
jgi:hypothetical protein